MVTFRVVPHPAEAQVLHGQNLARTMYSIGVEGGTGEALPNFLSVVMDQSGSMQGGKLEAAKQAIHLDVVDFLTKPCALGDLEIAT